MSDEWEANCESKPKSYVDLRYSTFFALCFSSVETKMKFIDGWKRDESGGCAGGVRGNEKN